MDQTYHYVASWYRQSNGTSEDFQLLRDQLEPIRNKHKYNPLGSCPRGFQLQTYLLARQTQKSDTPLCQSEGNVSINIMSDHDFEPLGTACTLPNSRKEHFGFT